MEAKEVQTQTRSAAAARVGFCGLLSARDRVLRAAAHVGNNTVSAAVLFRVWVHGLDELAANGEWQTFSCTLASVENLDSLRQDLQD